MFSCLTILCTLLHIVHNCYCLDEFKLQYVQILFRHGDRAPIHLYPTDPNPRSYWNEGLGSLTLLGRRQHYTFGKVLRKMYENFISSSPLEVNIQSSDCDRCIKSAESNLASFYAPDAQWQFEPAVNWQPLTVSYIAKHEDMYLETDSYCPKASEEQKRIVMSQEGQQFINEHLDMFRNLSQLSGMPITNWTSASYLYDTLFIERKYNLTVPRWANVFWDELHNVSDLSFYWSFKSPLLLRLRAGPLIGLIVDNMKRKISGEDSTQKVQVLSGHDTNVAVVLQALSVFNMKQPPYCAAVVFELYKSVQGYSVRLLYFNSSSPEQGAQFPSLLTLNGCTEYCPFDFFLNYTEHLIPKDWKEECSLKSSFILFSGIGMLVTVVITAIAVISLMSICIFWKVWHKRKDASEYSYQLMASEPNNYA